MIERFEKFSLNFSILLFVILFSGFLQVKGALSRYLVTL